MSKCLSVHGNTWPKRMVNTNQRVSDDPGEEDDDVEGDEDHLERVHAHPTPGLKRKS